MIPSQIGALGIELTDQVITYVVIVPKGAERRTFVPFAKAGASEDLDEVLGRFSEYLAGARRKLNLPYELGPHPESGFARRVLRQTAKIPYGQTRTYQEIALAAGRPDAYRLVLSTLLLNPLPLVIPCHRVVTVKSGAGSYIAGERKKTWLLRMEQRGLASSAV